MVVAILGLGFCLFLAVWLFGDVELGVHRRPLQNAVRRVAYIARWWWAVYRAVDHGLVAYYEAMETAEVEPRNELGHPPRRAEHALLDPRYPDNVLSISDIS